MAAGIEVTEGPLEGWEFLVKVVTNNCGMMAIVAGGNEAAILVGPTEDPEAIIAGFAEYMRDDS